MWMLSRKKERRSSRGFNGFDGFREAEGGFQEFVRVTYVAVEEIDSCTLCTCFRLEEGGSTPHLRRFSGTGLPHASFQFKQ